MPWTYWCLAVYALNPALDLAMVPVLSCALARRRHFSMIRVGFTFAAIAPLIIPCFGASLASVIAFVLVLTLGDMVRGPPIELRITQHAVHVARSTTRSRSSTTRG